MDLQGSSLNLNNNYSLQNPINVQPSSTVQLQPATDPTSSYYYSDPTTTNTGQVLGTSYTAPAPTVYYDNYGNPFSTQAQATANNQQVALYDQAIGGVNSEIGRLPGQLGAATTSVDNQYQTALDQLLGAKNQAESTYNTNKTQTAQDYLTSKNQINTNAGNSLRSLLRLLGSQGAGGSSAYLYSAPNAVGTAAAQQRAGVGQTFGRNQQALDTAWGNYLTGYNNKKLDVGAQRDTSKATLQDQFNTENASLLQQLASLSAQRALATGGNPTGSAQTYLDQANTLLNKVGTYVAPKINYTTEAYTAPNLDTYTTAPNAAPTLNSTASSSDFTSPFLSALLGKNKTQLAALGY